MATQNNKNGRFLGHFQTFSFGLVGKALEVKINARCQLYSSYYCHFLKSKTPAIASVLPNVILSG